MHRLVRSTNGGEGMGRGTQTSCRLKASWITTFRLTLREYKSHIY